MRDCGVARTLLYKTGPPILSRTFLKNNLRTRVRVGFDNFVDRIVAYILDSRIANNISDPNPAFAVLVELPSDVGVTTTWSWTMRSVAAENLVSE